MRLVPLSEGRCINLYHSGPGKGVGADEFVVGGVEGDDDDADLAGDALGAPGEIAGIETQSAVFCVAASGSDEVDSLVADAGIGWLTALFKGSVNAEIRQIP